MIFVIVLIIAIAATIVAVETEIMDIVNLFSAIIAVLAWIAAVIMLCCIIGNHVNLDAKVAKYEEQYNALVYKVESPACRDEFGFVNKEIIDEVEDWNSMIMNWRYSRKNLWVGIFYPNNAYEHFETIDYETFRDAKR